MPGSGSDEQAASEVGKAPSCRWRMEGLVPNGGAVAGISAGDVRG
jgi:hypothetical protein